MRRTAGAIAAALLLASFPASAESWERFPGVVGTPTPDVPGEIALRPARCLYLALGPVMNGVWAFVIEIPSTLSDGAHPFRLLDGRMSAVDGLIDEPANFDVAFYDTLATCETEPAPQPVRFRGPGDEFGIVPAGARYAIVTLTNKLESSFDFEIRAD